VKSSESTGVLTKNEYLATKFAISTSSTLTSQFLGHELQDQVRINTAFASAVFNNVGGLGDIPEAPVRSELLFWNEPDPNDRCKYIVEKYLVPDIKARDATSLAAARLAVQFVLTFTPDEAHNYFYGCLPSFQAPNPSVLLFEWIWEGVWPGENHHLDASLEYEVVSDHDQTNSIHVSADALIPNPFEYKEYR
jgi:hypothetical protein